VPAKQSDDTAEDETKADPGKPIALRSNFDALAFYAPSAATGADGTVKVTVKVPDNLTRYRITAVAVHGDQQFGKGESVITARLPLMVRPSAPRFLNFGDVFELPVVLQNQTDEPMEVAVALRGSNIQLDEKVGRLVTVPANERIEVRFPASALFAGTARFQVGAAAGRWNDAAEVSLPVWTPATTEAFATYGEIDGQRGTIVQPIKLPGAIWTQFGGVEITTSSTAVAALTDAVLYLVKYPYDCAEQVASRILAIAGLRDVLAAFAVPGLPAAKVLAASVDDDLLRLIQLQRPDGGWGFWHDDDDFPYLTVHVAHALVRAGEKGYKVPADTLTRALGYLEHIEAHLPRWYDAESRRAIETYALYVRERAGKPDHARARKLIAEWGGVNKVPLECAGWLLFVLSGDRGASAELAGLRRLLNDRVEETAAYAHFTTSYADGQYLLLASDRRADAIILEALIKDQPKSDLIPKIVKGLLAHRTAGHWASTNENAFVLLALDEYFDTYEKATPDFVARVWLGQAFAGNQPFKGRGKGDEHLITVPMAWLDAASAKLQGKPAPLTIDKSGAGRHYYRIGMKYAPKDLAVKARDAGFVVERQYAAVDDPGDVVRDKSGTWRIKAGARVRIKLTMVAQARRYHVALVDPLPAGLEPMNPALAVTGRVPEEKPDEDPAARAGGSWGWWYRQHWYQHENMRDERVEAFTTLLWEGVYSYTYVARATTPGTFVVPPTKAEEMYNPETFGRSASDTVIVQ
jgi:uncharacterized protein YfaS (alpha-2-macroglobulin family)